MVTDKKYDIDIFLGIGGGPEGVLAATALDAFNCKFQGRFLFKTDEDIIRANNMGIKDLNKKYDLNEIVKGDSIFCATGITSNDLVNGVKLESGNYITNSLDQGNTNTHNIIVPAGTQEVKVMVYWHDKEASTSASTALVNNLNMQLTSPTGITYDPWVLDHTPNASNLNQIVVEHGIDTTEIAGNILLPSDLQETQFIMQNYYINVFILL